MMQDYRVEEKTTAPVGVLAATTTNGRLQIFNASTNGHLMRLRRDAASLTGWVEDDLALASDIPGCNAVWSYDDGRGNPSLLLGVPGRPLDGEPLGLFNIWVTENGQVDGSASGWSPVSGMGSFMDLTAANPPPFLTASPLGDGSLSVSGYLRPLEPMAAYTMTGNERIPLAQGDKIVTVPGLYGMTVVSFIRAHGGGGGLEYFEGTVSGDGQRPWKLLCNAGPIGDRTWVVNDFVVVRSWSADSAQVIAAVGTNLCTLTGVADGKGGIAWPRSWSVHDVGGMGAAGIAEVRARVKPNSVELTIKDSAGRLMSVIQDDPLHWVAVPITDQGVRQWLLVEEAGQHGFLFADAQGRLNLHMRGNDGDYRIERIEIDGGGEVEEITSYRAGITIARPDKVGVSGAEVAVEASTAVVVTINGAPYLIGPGNPAIVKTDSTGSLWVTTTLDNSLSAPVYAFTSALLEGGRLEIQPDADTHDFLKTVTPEGLLAGKIVGNAQDAEAVVKGLRQVLAMSDHAYHPVADGPANLRVAAQRGVKWRARSAGTGGVLRQSEMPNEAWRFSVRGGRPAFETLTAEVARAALAERRAAGSRPAGDLFSFNPFSADDWADACSSVADTFTSVVEIVSDGAQAAITFLVNGVEFALTALIDTAAKVFDLVNSIFDAAGVAMGTVVGWVLDQIGFLFGWDDIKKQRDAFKTMAMIAMRNAPKSMPSPKASAGTFIAFLEEAKRDMASWVAQARSLPVSSQQFALTTQHAPALANLFRNAQGLSALPQATWITDKLQEALRLFSSGLPFPAMPGLDEALSRFEAALAEAAGALDLGSEMEALVGRWISDSAAFSGGSIDPLLDFIEGAAGPALDAMKGLAEAGAGVLQLFWDDPQMLFDWLDSPIHAPFFSAFYKAVLNNDFSALDVVCLAAAISAVATGRTISPPIQDRLGDSAGQREALLTLMEIGCVITGLSGAATAAQGDPSLGFVRILAFLRTTVVAIVACGVQSRAGGWPPIQATQSAVAILTALYTSKNLSPRVLVGAATIQCILNIVRCVIDRASGNVIAYTSFEGIQVAAYCYALKRGAMPPMQALLFGGFQGAMSGFMTFFWSADNPALERPNGASLTPPPAT